MEDVLNSSILGGRRPASPLADPAYQPMAVSFRPGTPSNVMWNTSTTSFSSNAPKSHARNKSGDSGCSRCGSVSMDESPVAATDQSNPATGRPLRSPMLPDSLTNHRHPTLASTFGWDSEPSMNKTPAVIPSLELGALMAMANCILHSPTSTRLVCPHLYLGPATSHRTQQAAAPLSKMHLHHLTLDLLTRLLSHLD